MGVTSYGMTAKKIIADMNGQRVEVRLIHYLDRDNRFSEDTLMDRARARYAKGEKALYGTVAFDNSRNGLHGNVVFRIPEDYNGTHRTYDAENWEVVGTLLYDVSLRPQFRLETDEQVVEKIRRQHEFQAMHEKRLSVGQFYNDVNAYKAHLAEVDAGSPLGMRTRKHGF